MNDKDRFSRTKLLIGPDGLERLNNSQVAVFGIGGVGSFVVEGLARAGIGKLLLVDPDVVVPSNINRQILALHSTLGRPKVEVMKERIMDINPEALVEVKRVRYTPDAAEDFFCSSYDYVVDAVDDVKAKVSLAAECVKRGLRFISSMGAGNRLEAGSFRISDIADTFGDPLAKRFRKLLKQQSITSGVKVVFSPDPPFKGSEMPGELAGEDQNPPGRVIGSISFVPSVAGLLIAGEVVRDLLKDKKNT